MSSTIRPTYALHRERTDFAALAQKKDKPMTKWMQTVITTYDVKPDAATHEVNCIFHFAKAAQSPR